MSLLYLYFVLTVLVGIMAMIRGRSGVRWFFIALFTTPLISGLLVMALPRQPTKPKFADEPSPHFVPMPANSVIRIVRRPGYPSRRLHEILVNGVKVGTVSPDSITDFHVPTGSLVIRARDEWGNISDPLVIEAKPDRAVEIEVLNDLGPVLTKVANTLGLGNDLTLRPVMAA